MSPRTGLWVAAAGVALCVLGLIGGFVFAEDDEPTVSGATTTTATTAADETTTSASSSTTTTVDPAELVGLDDVRAFYELFEEAVQTGDGDDLHARLHPAVFELYGEEQCRAFVDAGFDNPDLGFEAQSVGPLGPWTWERDGRSVAVADAVAVQLVQRTPANVEPAPQEAHVALVDGELRWFTDCGEPLPTGAS